MNRWDFFKLMLVGWLIVLMTDLYLPSFPVLATDFGVSVHSIQLTVTFFFIGNLLSQLFSGVMVAHHGHLLMLAIGLILCFFGSLLSALTTSFGVMLGGRFIQGVGTAAMQVANMAQFKSLCPKEHLAKYSSLLGISYVGAIAVVPVFGGYILHYIGWRACFITMAFSGLALFLCHRASVGQIRPSPGYPSFSRALHEWRTLLLDRSFITLMAIYACTFVSVIAWITAAPVLMRVHLGIAPVPFGWWLCSIAGMYVVAAFVNAKVVNTFGDKAMLRFGLLLWTSSVMALLAAWYCYGLTVLSLILPMWGIMAGVSFMFPNIFSMAFKEMPQERMGNASAIYGMAGIIGACLGSAFMAWAPMEDQQYFAWTLSGISFTACLLYLSYLKRCRAIIEPTEIC